MSEKGRSIHGLTSTLPTISENGLNPPTWVETMPDKSSISSDTTQSLADKLSPSLDKLSSMELYGLESEEGLVEEGSEL